MQVLLDEKREDCVVHEPVELPVHEPISQEENKRDDRSLVATHSQSDKKGSDNDECFNI